MNPLFQHRHFVAIAKIIDSFTTNESLKTALAQHFAENLKHTNGNFSVARFVAAAKGDPMGQDK